MFKYLTFLISVVLVMEMLGVTSGEKKVYRIDAKPKEDKKNCQLKALDQCLNRAYYFTHSFNATDSGADHNHFDNMCRAVIKVINCMDKYFSRCSHSEHKEIYQMGKQQFYQSWTQICTEGPVRDNYIKHSKCIQKTIRGSDEYKNVCLSNAQKAFEKTKTLNTMIDTINIGCCAFNQWQDCIDGLVETKCGLDGKEAIKSLIEKASGGLVYNLCTKDYFQSGSPLCDVLFIDKQN